MAGHRIVVEECGLLRLSQLYGVAGPGGTTWFRKSAVGVGAELCAVTDLLLSQCGPQGYEWSGKVTEGIGGFCPKGYYMIGDKCENLGDVNFGAVPYGLPTGKVSLLLFDL
jgi:hypothetical protein